MASIVKRRSLMSRTVVSLALVLLWSFACGGSEIRGTPERVLVRVDPEDSLEDVARKAHAVGGGGRDCLFVWGDVVTQPAEATPVRLQWAELEHLDGYVLCGEEAELVLLDPRARHLAMLYYRDDMLHVGHPTDGGTAPLRRTTLGLRSDAPVPCLGVFDPDSSDRRTPAFVVFRQLREVPRDFLIAAMPVEARDFASGGELEAAGK